jgi:hypothetical protein
MEPNRPRVYGPDYNITDSISENSTVVASPLRLDAYQCDWLAARA